MAGRQLTFRLAGITAICLAALVIPVTSVDRIAVLTAASLGIGFAAVMPGYDRVAARAVGPAVLVLALVPPTGLWVLVDLLALFVIGFASFERAGMARVVPAIGLPIATVAFRTGQPLEPSIVVAWAAAVTVTLLVHGVAWPVEDGTTLGQPDDDPRPVVYGWRPTIQAAVLVALTMPLGLSFAAVVDRELPSFVLAQPRLGDLTGPQLRAHPGLTGGLDAGSPVNLSDDVVLRVRADRPLYWRGTTYDRWDGRRWSNDDPGTPITWSGDGVRLPGQPGPAGTAAFGAGGTAELPAAETVLQQFTAERAGMDVILAAWRPDALWATAHGADLGRDGSIRLREPLGAGATWTVESTVVPATEDDLRRADPLRLTPGSAILTRFAVEDDITPEVAALARTITAGADTTYDKIRALEDWMDANISYTRSIPRLAEGDDAVHHLLFESQQGYCEQIGSALVVMLRSLGIPSRLVVGYVPGTYDAATGEWVSRGTDAHAWAEVYFPGVGWQGFDPTAGVPPTAADRGPTPVLGDLPVTAVVLAVGTALVVGGLAHRYRSVLGQLLARRRGRRATAREPKLDLQRRFNGCGTGLERDWSQAMTLREKGSDLVAAGIGADPVERVLRSLERLWYDDLTALDADAVARTVARATADVEALEQWVEATAAQQRPGSGLGPEDRFPTPTGPAL